MKDDSQVLLKGQRGLAMTSGQMNRSFLLVAVLLSFCGLLHSSGVQAVEAGTGFARVCAVGPR